MGAVKRRYGKVREIGDQATRTQELSIITMSPS